MSESPSIECSSTGKTFDNGLQIIASLKRQSMHAASVRQDGRRVRGGAQCIQINDDEFISETLMYCSRIESAVLV